MLRDEYRIKRVSKVSANTIEEFAHKLEGVDPLGFLDEIKKYNAAVKKGVQFNPNIKDGRCTVGLDDQQVELGEHHRGPAVRGLSGRLRRDRSASAACASIPTPAR